MITQCQVTAHFKLGCEKGFAVITFYSYKFDHFCHKISFFSSKLSVKFKKFAQVDFRKIVHNFTNNM
jgi:hypothetical protein